MKLKKKKFPLVVSLRDHLRMMSSPGMPTLEDQLKHPMKVVFFIYSLNSPRAIPIILQRLDSLTIFLILMCLEITYVWIYSNKMMLENKKGQVGLRPTVFKVF